MLVTDDNSRTGEREQHWPVEPLIDSAGLIFEIVEQVADLVGPHPDLVVIQGGENDTWDEAFPDSYTKFALALGQVCAPKGKVILLGDWYSHEKQPAAGKSLHTGVGHGGTSIPYSKNGLTSAIVALLRIPE